MDAPGSSSMSAAGGVARGGEYAENSLIQQLAFEDEVHPRAVRFVRDHRRRRLRRRRAECAAQPQPQQQRQRPDRPLVIVDHGCADGLTTCKLLRALAEDAAADAVSDAASDAGSHGRPEPAGVAITAVFQDLPGNDWDAAAGTVSRMMATGVGGAAAELLPAPLLPELLLAGAPPPPYSSRPFSLVACPGNFYDRLLPEGTVDLSVSGSSYHWLSSTDGLPLPPPPADGPAAGTTVLDPSRFPPAVKAEWSRRAAEDWATILRVRCSELRSPGGTLVAVVPCSPCMPTALEILERTFVEFGPRRGSGRTESSVGVGGGGGGKGFVIPCYLDRTEADLRDGFAGLPMRVDVCEVRPRANPYLPPADGNGFRWTDDARRVFGERMVGWCFGWGARLISDAVGKDNVAAFRSLLAEGYARYADDDGLKIGMGCGVVVAERL